VSRLPADYQPMNQVYVPILLGVIGVVFLGYAALALGAAYRVTQPGGGWRMASAVLVLDLVLLIAWRGQLGLFGELPLAAVTLGTLACLTYPLWATRPAGR
jgi:hypothetical protein